MFEVKGNENYTARIVKIELLKNLDNCDNVLAAIIMGNQVIVSNTTKEGDIGIFFPVETQLSEKYVAYNNLFRDSKKNRLSDTKGYFDDNRRVRCVKFRNNRSEGLFMPISSLEYLKDIKPKLNVDFDTVNGEEICRKYTVPVKNSHGVASRSIKKVTHSKLHGNQFNFHKSTSPIYKNLHYLKPEAIIQLTSKFHGCNGVSSNILCNKKLSWTENILKKYFKLNITDKEYSNIYSSRNVIKNEDLDIDYSLISEDKKDIWDLANEYLKPYITKGMTMYYEIVGYYKQSNIQGMGGKPYSYGCVPLEDNAVMQENVNYKVVVFRITHTNQDGQVFEFSAKQVQDYCKKFGIKAVPELYYGYASDLYTLLNKKYKLFKGKYDKEFSNRLLELMKLEYLEKDCPYCNNGLPDEGVVIRIEDLNIESFKLKSLRFLEGETSDLDKGNSNIEDEN